MNIMSISHIRIMCKLHIYLSILTKTRFHCAYILPPIPLFMLPHGVEYSGEGIIDCRPHNAKLFERIEHSSIR